MRLENSLLLIVTYEFEKLFQPVEKSRFWGCLKSTLKLIFRPVKSIKSRFCRPKSRFKSDKKTLLLHNFKGRACKLDFPALHESNFTAYITGCQLFGPEKSVKVDLCDRKDDKKSILDPKLIVSIVFST